MKEIQIKRELISIKIPIPVRGKLITQLELIKINEITFFNIPFYHQQAIEQKIEQISHFLKKKLEIHQLHPEAKFLIEANQTSFHHLSCRFNFLFTDFQFEYYDCVKVKVSPSNFNLIPLIKLNQNPKISSIRLDGNQSFNKNELELFLNELKRNNISKIEYFEEPCLNLTEAKDLLSNFKIPMAIDESFKNINIQDFDAFILRPSLVGFSESIEFINQAIKLNKKVTISSGYEIDKGMNALIFISDYYNHVSKSQNFHGLDTFKFFDSKYFSFIQKDNHLSL